ncbi:hypothetical protein AN619_16610 [Thermotalea metallivorans]|uniref:Uncharacterized protein n=1 Tax=Thermotalea metallivorans TaxID=520762 RepID=A0A140L540_9FIRM|nr:hypothetical protein AN619_16610 [Thermotalea metallivorans]
MLSKRQLFLWSHIGHILKLERYNGSVGSSIGEGDALYFIVSAILFILGIYAAMLFVSACFGRLRR